MIKKLVNFFLNFIMSVLVFGFICINLISNTVFNKEYIKQKLSENKFYDKAYSDIKDDFENYTMQSGLELEILDGLFSKEKVQKDINLKLDSIYEGKKVNIETDSIKNELDSRINLALEKNNRVPSEKEKESIQKYEDVICESYEKGILYGKDFTIEKNWISLAYKICIIGFVIISIVLILINRKVLKYFSFIGINLVFSGVLCSVIRILLEKRVIHILILDSKFSNFLVNSLTDILERFYKCGLSVVIIGLVLIILGSLEKNKKTIENKKD